MLVCRAHVATTARMRAVWLVHPLQKVEVDRCSVVSERGERSGHDGIPAVALDRVFADMDQGAPHQ
jgi:hypothetical protein